MLGGILSHHRQLMRDKLFSEMRQEMQLEKKIEEVTAGVQEKKCDSGQLDDVRVSQCQDWCHHEPSLDRSCRVCKCASCDICATFGVSWDAIREENLEWAGAAEKQQHEEAKAELEAEAEAARPLSIEWPLTDLASLSYMTCDGEAGDVRYESVAWWAGGWEALVHVADWVEGRTVRIDYGSDVAGGRPVVLSNLVGASLTDNVAAPVAGARQRFSTS